MAGPLPYFNVWQKEYLSDGAVRRLPLAAKGLLIALQCHQWEDGSVPSDPDEAQRLVGEIDRKAFRDAWRRILPLFTVGEDTMFHPALDEQRRTTLAKIEKNRNREGDEAGGRPRGRTGTKPGDNRTVINSITETKPGENINQNQNHIDSSLVENGDRQGSEPSPTESDFDRKFGAFFREFREMYPQRKGNYGWQKAEPKLRAFLKQGVKAKRILDGLRAFAAHVRVDGKWGTPYVPMASTWVNGKGWEDDYGTGGLRVVAGGAGPAPVTSNAQLDDLARAAGIR